MNKNRTNWWKYRQYDKIVVFFQFWTVWYATRNWHNSLDLFCFSRHAGWRDPSAQGSVEARGSAALDRPGSFSFKTIQVRQSPVHSVNHLEASRVGLTTRNRLHHPRKMCVAWLWKHGGAGPYTGACWRSCWTTCSRRWRGARRPTTPTSNTNRAASRICSRAASASSSTCASRALPTTRPSWSTSAEASDLTRFCSTEFLTLYLPCNYQLVEFF